METRAVQTDELDEMLSLMCEAFLLPYAPSREIFYHDPFFNIQMKRVLVNAGQVLSCLSIVPSTHWVGHAVCKFGGIAGLATRADSRRMGYASQLLDSSLVAMPEMGIGIAALFPFDCGYYRKRGWVPVYQQYLLSITPCKLPRYREIAHVRPANISDIKELMALYNHTTQFKSGSRHRDCKRWNYLMNQQNIALFYRDNQTSGYLFCRKQETGKGIQLLIQEFNCESLAAKRGMIGYIGEMEGIDRIEYVASLEDIHRSGLHQPHIQPEESTFVSIQSQTGMMARIVDLQIVLEALRPNFKEWRGEVTLVMHDHQMHPHKPVGVHIASNGSDLQMNKVDPRHNSCKIEGAFTAWAPVLMGYQSLDDAVSLNSLHPDSMETVSSLSRIFPRRSFFVSPVDYF